VLLAGKLLGIVVCNTHLVEGEALAPPAGLLGQEALQLARVPVPVNGGEAVR
jgi:hypothetical protein